jgi:DNA mismatch repair ATPase MutS
MKARLMFKERDFPMAAPLPVNAALLIKDLELETLFAAMADGDPFLLEVARRAVLTSLETPETIVYRQQILTDCCEQAMVVREMYAIAVEALERERKIWGWTSLRSSPEGTLNRSRNVLEIFFELLKRLRRLAEKHESRFRSEGLSTLFQLLLSELSDDFLAEVEEHLEGLALRERMVMSAELGVTNAGTHYVLRKPPPRQGWWQRLQGWRRGTRHNHSPSYTYEIPERDEQGAHALGELRAKGVARVATALGQSTDHLLSFFGMLRRELAFYVGCLNLRDRLAGQGEVFCLPDPQPTGANALKARQLYDVALALKTRERVVGSDVSADDRSLVMITGANRGGKSTFLRSVGQAHLMMQCGLFVCAGAFHASLASGVFTHYKKEEDASMQSGKLDEELSRMSTIVDAVRSRGLVLCNESFGSTNEREGSEIARQIVTALLEHDIKVFYVTHMYELAHGFWMKDEGRFLFLRAERLPDGTRTFRMQEGEPLETSFGGDLYRQIFKAPSEERTAESAVAS